jgi:hypothetical protein
VGLNLRPMAYRPVFFACVLFAVTLLWPNPSAAAQSAADPSADTGTVVAAYTISRGLVQPDPSVNASPGKRRAYGAVEAYVWNALPPEAKSRVSRLELFVAPAS